ncbi:3-hydroxyacyl-ACP dehydratase FabZ [Candidatus Berkiella aquae]|uniref:3-hydroxyacyl-[acyl-carrier-protein] dehydratase FabZ n=1 Tax=Candidatus Berkiella aquae TaxID=295108 RepID=A0AAE3HVM5_9GAMM|nr:3-hydroxyacyl-ACP dehydratase FabZ [Candidatus Berkiella aquae]MCS5711164.1 3-hydroxyacyl-ACP dehydratase FabZ [Candidatus Berkiella aquae]
MESRVLNIHELIKMLPHRYPFLMIDKVLEYTEESLVGVKNVTMNEPCFMGHFPENPVMPGVLITEALAQAGAILAYLKTGSSPKEHLFFLAGIDNAKFKQMVIPGDQLILDVQIVGNKGNFWKIHGEAKVDGKLVCSVDILSAMRKLASDLG